MSKEATKLQAIQAHDSSTVLLNKVCHDKHVSNQGRIKASHKDESGNLLNSTTYDIHESRLKFLEPYLGSLPDTNLLHPAKELSRVISNLSIARKQRKESLAVTNSDTVKIPTSARFKFKLTPSDIIKNSPEFQAINNPTVSKLDEIHSFCKSKIVPLQKLEYSYAQTTLKKAVILQTLTLPNMLTKYYTITCEVPESNDPYISRITLSQLAVLCFFEKMKNIRPQIKSPAPKQEYRD